MTVLAALFSVGFVIAYKLYLSAVRVYWLDWSDQSEYLRSAYAFASFNTSSAEHWYPLLYSLMAAPFLFLPAWAAFGIVDLACILGAFGGFRIAAARFGFGGWAALSMFAGSTVLYPKFLDEWLTPWTTTLSACLIWQSIGRVFAVIDGQPISKSRSAMLGALLALIPCARPADLFISVFLGGWVLISFIRNDRKHVLGFVGTGVGIILIYAILYCSIYGLHATTYMELSAAYGFNFHWLDWKCYILLVEPRPWFPDGYGLLKICPWLILGLAGIIVSLISDHRRRAFTFCLFAVSSVYLIMILSYVDLLPSGMWRFNNIHYFKWLLPLYALFAVSFLRDFQLNPWTNGLVIASIVIVSAIRPTPLAATDDQPARMIVFAGPTVDYSKIYMARSTIADGSGVMRNFFEYHQVPGDRGIVHAIALRRDFVGHERWSGNASGDINWPRGPGENKPGTPLPGDWPKQPIGRYMINWTIGWPCWLPMVLCSAGGLPTG